MHVKKYVLVSFLGFRMDLCTCFGCVRWKCGRVLLPFLIFCGLTIAPASSRSCFWAKMQNFYSTHASTGIVTTRNCNPPTNISLATQTLQDPSTGVRGSLIARQPKLRPQEQGQEGSHLQETGFVSDQYRHTWTSPNRPCLQACMQWHSLKCYITIESALGVIPAAIVE